MGVLVLVPRFLMLLLRRCSSLPCPSLASPSSPRELRWTTFEDCFGKLYAAPFCNTHTFQGLLERSWLVGVLPLEILTSYILSQFLVIVMQVGKSPSLMILMTIIPNITLNTNRWQLHLWWFLASSRSLVLVPYPSSSYSVFFKVKEISD